MQTSSRFEELFRRWVNGQTTPAETEELMDMLERSDPDRELTPLLKQAWDELEARQVYTARRKDEMVDKILQQTSSKGGIRLLSRRYWWWSAAAVLVIAAVVLWWAPRPVKKQLFVRVDTVKDVAPGKQGAILTLANGRSIVLDSIGNGVIASQNGTQVIFSNGSLRYDAGRSAGISYNIITTPRGRKFQLVLPDSTKVWLNAGSSLRYPTAFSGPARVVEVSGEAYFEVTKNQAMPFCVKVNDHMQVKVLGTSFNVNAYSDEPNINTTLLEGAVLVETAAGKSLRINPGQQASVLPDASIALAMKVNTDQVIAWKDGFFNFNGASLQQVMRQLARWYDIDVVYEGSIPGIVFDGELPTSLQLSQVLKILSRVDVKYRIEDGKRLIILP